MSYPLFSLTTKSTLQSATPFCHDVIPLLRGNYPLCRVLLVVKKNVEVVPYHHQHYHCQKQVLAFIVSRDTSPIGNKVPDQEFYWSANHEFYTRFGI